MQYRFVQVVNTTTYCPADKQPITSHDEHPSHALVTSAKSSLYNMTNNKYNKLLPNHLHNIPVKLHGSE